MSFPKWSLHATVCLNVTAFRCRHINNFISFKKLTTIENTLYLLLAFSVHSSTLKMDGVMMVNFYHITWHYILEDSTHRFKL